MRLHAVDALRALALLGILSVNIWFFAYPELLQTGTRSTPVESSADQLVRLTSTLLFESKSYVVFSFLFGQGPMALAAFLIGLVVGRAKLLERMVDGEIPTAKLLAWMLPALIIGFALSGSAAVMLWGTPGSTAPAAATTAEMLGAELTAMGMLFLAGPIQGTGYVILALLIFRSAAASGLVAALAPAGRMSLTNYLSQSLVLMLIFSGVGFGLGGELNALAVAGVVVVLWLAQLALSALWFTRFRRGPLEAPMRAWTYAGAGR